MALGLGREPRCDRLALGERDEARRQLERVLEVAPDYAQAAAVRALLDQIGRGPGG